MNSTSPTSIVQIVGDFPDVSTSGVIALHDPTGSIRQLEHIVAFEGAEPVTEEIAYLSAFEYARKLGLDTSNLSALWVPEVNPTGRSWRVDVERGSLIELEMPARQDQRNLGNAHPA